MNDGIERFREKGKHFTARESRKTKNLDRDFDSIKIEQGPEEPRAPAHFDGVVRADGWTDWNLKDATRFNGFIEPLCVRREADTPDGRPQARVRMHPIHKHSNLGNHVHGAVTLALIDVSLFAAAHQFGSLNAGFSVTLDLSTQFVGGGRIGQPMDAVVELVRETGRLVFLRGMVVQGEGDNHIVAAFSGTIRKAARDS